jgi:DnaJ homolog subfamily C member 25
VKIARAYEVLTDIATRKEYDQLRYDQPAYYKKYGTSVMWSYAPKTDVTIVVLIVLVVANIVSWYTQKHRWQLVADRLIKAAVEDWSPRDGGTEESKHLREEALAMLEKRQEENHANDDSGPSTLELLTSSTSNGTTSKGSTKKKSNASSKSNAKVKLNLKEKKKLEQDAILPIITELVYAMDDFGSGFHKPTWKDLFIISMMKWPYSIGKTLVWQLTYTIRRLQKLELNEEEKQVLTSNAVGPVLWNSSSDEEKQQMITKKLWKKDNLVAWHEEQEFKKLSKSEQKIYLSLKKKGKLDKLEGKPDKLE